MLKWAVSGIQRFQSKRNNRASMQSHTRPTLIRGSDPLMQTARGKLQNQRSKLNDQINRQLRLRAGAENLLKVTTDKSLKEKVSLELSYVNSNLQVLKEELADLNSSVQIYQHDAAIQCVPMLPLGLKETREMDFSEPFKEYILQHYMEDAYHYEEELLQLNEMRQACRTPVRSDVGIELLFEYYNQLYFIDKRFFPLDENNGIIFEWYDSLTGIPSAQRTAGFEKGSVLFNIGALYTQLGARQNRTTHDGIELAIENFQRAAGSFTYLQDNFSHAPSMDMQPVTLSMLIQLMMAQCQECIYEQVVLGGQPIGFINRITVAKEAAMVSEQYAAAHRLMSVKIVQDYVPLSWLSMAEVKRQYFASLAHFHTALAFISEKDYDEVTDIGVIFHTLHAPQTHTINTDDVEIITKIPADRGERETFAKAHLRASLIGLEEALRLHGLSKQLRRIDTFHHILKKSLDTSLAKYAQLEDEDDFSDVLLSVPDILGKSHRTVSAILPDFVSHKVIDLFEKLGPLAIFSSRHKWTRSRTIEMRKSNDHEFGFSVRGDSPVIVATVEEGSLAQKGGMKTGDFVVAINHLDVKWSKHDEVVKMIRESSSHLCLTLITVTDRNFLDPNPPPLPTALSSPSADASVIAQDDAKHGQNLQTKPKMGLSWTLRRKLSSSRDKYRTLPANGHITSTGTLK